MINQDIDILDLNGYNLSYDFLNSVIGIDVNECYPYKNGFFIIDQNGNNYLIFKILERDVEKYIQIFDVLQNINSINRSIQGMHFFMGNKYFIDKSTGHYYVVFNYPNGEYIKWLDFNINSIKDILINFYNGSQDILKDLYNFNLKEDVKLLTIGDEVKEIDEYLLNIQNIEIFILHKYNKDRFDDLFLENKTYMKDELIKIRKFFTSSKFKNYVSNHKNIRFINGNLSNKSFIFNNDRSYIINFYNASIDLFIKDIGILSEKAIFNINMDEFKTFIINFLSNFEGNINEHIEMLFNYIRLNNRMFKWFNTQYKNIHYSGRKVDLDSKISEIYMYKQNINDFINILSFT